MKKPRKPVIKGDTVQLVEHKIGYIYRGLKVAIYSLDADELQWFQEDEPSKDTFKSLASTYLRLDEILKDKGYVSFKISKGSIYAYKEETPYEVECRLIEEDKAIARYKSQLDKYSQWLKREINRL